MKMKFTLALIVLVTTAAVASGASLPGFQMKTIGPAHGYLTALAVDSKGIIYYSAQEGAIYRFTDGQSTQVVKLHGGLGMTDAGLLGMALLDDETAAVHYTVPASDPEQVLYDGISRINLRTGIETLLRAFYCDIEVPERGCSMLHHGGNPVAAPDGSIFVGIGEYGGRSLAQMPEWNGGKMWRVYPDGSAVQYAIGLRNPFDFVWDDHRQVLIVPDNGDEGSDELHILSRGANAGYPLASSNQPHLASMSPPVYVWDPTISPCGTIAASGANDQLRSGLLVVGYVSKSVHYVPDPFARPMPAPIVILDATKENAEFVDIAEAPDGTIYLADLFRLYQLIPPARGDCNGDAVINAADVSALTSELADAPEARIHAQNGSYRGSWGCDANGDDRIDAADMSALAGMLGRRRSAAAGR